MLYMWTSECHHEMPDGAVTMARSDYSQFAPRRPRHAVRETAALHVQVQRAAQASPRVIDAELLDFSRSGFRLRLPAPLDVKEPITLRVGEEKAGIDLTLSGIVRWRRAEHGGTWLLGCATDHPTDWETLGELFLNKILSTEGTPHDAR